MFIRHFRDNTILHYDKNGRKVGRFGRKDDGPGELGYCLYLYCVEEKIYINDNRANFGVCSNAWWLRWYISTATDWVSSFYLSHAKHDHPASCEITLIFGGQLE